MSTDISELEQQVEEFELLLNGGLHLTHDKLLDRINELWTLLKSRCQKNEINEEIVKRPIEQLTALLNVVNDVREFPICSFKRMLNTRFIPGYGYSTWREDPRDRCASKLGRTTARTSQRCGRIKGCRKYQKSAKCRSTRGYNRSTNKQIYGHNSQNAKVSAFLLMLAIN